MRSDYSNKKARQTRVLGRERNGVSEVSSKSDPVFKEDYSGKQYVNWSEVRRWKVILKSINYPFLVVVIKNGNITEKNIHDREKK